VITPVFYDRYLLSVVAGTTTLIFLGTRKYFGIMAVLLMLFYGLFSFELFNNPSKRPFRELASYVKEEVKEEDYLINYNIKPRDILDLISEKEILDFCIERNIKNRGDKILKILDNYKDSENLYLENFENIGYRKYNELKENGISIKESEIGVKFEELTKTILKKTRI